jgi:hypothetical protein
MSEYTRYIYKQEPITEREAALSQLRRIMNLREQAADLRVEADNLDRLSEEIRNEPLPTTKKVRIALEPGDEGFDEAPVHFDPTRYQGGFQWVNQTPTP